MRHAIRPDVWDSLFTFSVVRNPWERFWSLYRFRIVLGDLPESCDFLTYVRKLKHCRYRDRYSPFYMPHYHMSMCDFLLDGEGGSLVDRIYRIEEREALAEELRRRFNVDVLHEHREKLSDELTFKQFYDAESVDIVGRFYQDDIEQFGYDYEA